MSVVIVDLDRRRVSLVKNFQFLTQYFYFPGRDGIVSGAFRTQTHQSTDFQDKFISHCFSSFKNICQVRVEHTLQHAIAVPQIDKNHTTMITTAIYPTTNNNFLINMRGIDITTIMTTHEYNPLENKKAVPDQVRLRMICRIIVSCKKHIHRNHSRQMSHLSLYQPGFSWHHF